MLVDLSSLKGVHVDPERGTARANAGVLWGEYDREPEMFSLATPGGRVTTTGVGGFCLGGGYGWLSTKYGLTCDNLVGADLLTASEQLMHVTDDTDPEVMWALRGAGSNFGVVTSFDFRVHPIPPLLMAGLWPCPTTTGQQTSGAPTGQPMLGIVAAYPGDPGDAEAAVAPLRQLTEGGVDMVQPMPYTAFQAMLDPFAPKGWLSYHRGQHLAALPDAVLDDYVDVGRTIGSPMTQGIIFRNGGVTSDVAEDATAAGNRAAPYMGHPIACWQDAADSDRELDRVRRFSAAFEPALTGGVYLNFEPETQESDVRAGFGDAKYERLAALRQQWDPENVFAGNHNVPPQGA